MSHANKNTGTEKVIEEIAVAIAAVRKSVIPKFVAFLRESGNPAAATFANRLEHESDGPGLKEAILSQIVRHVEEHQNDISIPVLREIVGWQEGKNSFEGLSPEFLDVVYLLSPRDDAVIETLVPVVTRLRDRAGQRLRLLDIGSGTGLFAAILDELDLLPEEYVGLEPASNLVEFASSRVFKNPKAITFQRTSVQNYQPAASDHQSFDVIICHMVLHHVRKEGYKDDAYTGVLRKVKGVLAQDGIFVYTDKLFEGGRVRNVYEPLRDPRRQGRSRSSIPPSFQPHPKTIKEAKRHWIDKAADDLCKVGFHIDSGSPINDYIARFVCGHCPDKIGEVWRRFNSANTARKKLEEDNLEIAYDSQINAPYQWIFECLKALFEDLTGQVCPADHRSPYFVRGIAYFSWERDSRIFLVRRAVPFSFHVLSYSHVHDGWGVLGKMVEDFEKDPRRYTRRKAFSSLSAGESQRTLPFLGDIKSLNYTAAAAIPIYGKRSYDLKGAFLLFLHREEHSPSKMPVKDKRVFRRKCRELNEGMNFALKWQDRKLGLTDSGCQISTEWHRLVSKDENPPHLVIAKLILELMHNTSSDASRGRMILREVASKIQAALSSGDSFSVIDEGREGEKIEESEENSRIQILVAARMGIPFEELRRRILRTIGDAADNCGHISFRCIDLHKEKSRHGQQHQRRGDARPGGGSELPAGSVP